MKKRLHVYASSWNKTQLEVTFEPKTPSEYSVPLGTMQLNIPDDLIPSDETFNAMVQATKVKAAEHRLNLARNEVSQAEEALAELRALPCV